ncbi:MAG: hypothetical protein HUJ83_10460, partial [Veillonella sp.]|nr:hypothetical protein [Veillonella sp.]
MRKYKYTEEDIIDLLKTNNEHVKYIDGFIDSRVHKAKFLCTKYNEVFYSIPASVYWKRSCPVCYKHRLKEENVIKNLSNNNPNIEYVSGYIEARKPATFRCKLCAYEWSSTAADVYKGKTRCPNCRTNLHANTIDDIEKKL